ncbi:MAG: RNA polymerase sigma factor [Bryobacteraceae bacterium]|jgi:RNA polymerase sigma-70 factor (ECF subfamily)
MVAENAAQDRKAAFLRIYEQYAPALQRLAGAYAVAREDREDLVQEIAAALWRALPGYRGESSERTWLYRIAHNVAITATVRQRKRNRREAAPDQPPDLPSAGATAEQNLLAEEKRRMLFAAIRGLAAADRHITVLHLEGLSGAEAVTGIAEGAVATRLTRIREKLRQAIRARETGDGR